MDTCEEKANEHPRATQDALRFQMEQMPSSRCFVGSFALLSRCEDLLVLDMLTETARRYFCGDTNRSGQAWQKSDVTGEKTVNVDTRNVRKCTIARKKAREFDYVTTSKGGDWSLDEVVESIEQTGKKPTGSDKVAGKNRAKKGRKEGKKRRSRKETKASQDVAPRSSEPSAVSAAADDASPKQSRVRTWRAENLDVHSHSVEMKSANDDIKHPKNVIESAFDRTNGLSIRNGSTKAAGQFFHNNNTVLASGAAHFEVSRNGVDKTVASAYDAEMADVQGLDGKVLHDKDQLVLMDQLSQHWVHFMNFGHAPEKYSELVKKNVAANGIQTVQPQEYALSVAQPAMDPAYGIAFVQ